jgi:hypothetical protein
MKGRRASKERRALCGGERRVYMAILHGQTVQTGQRVTYISWSGRVRASKRDLILYGFLGAVPSVQSASFDQAPEQEFDLNPTGN